MTPGPDAAALFLVSAFTLSGACQTWWLSAPISRRFDWPLDGGRMWRGRRVLGANKTWRGVLVMVPATAVSFAIVRAAWPPAAADRLWALSIAEYAVLGFWAGLGFMAGELPNSFVKRQLDVPPGAAAGGRWRGPLLAVADRCDSVAGALIALAILVPVPPGTWIIVGLVGPALHGTFSVAMFCLGGKSRLG